MNAPGFDLRQYLGEGTQGFGMRVSDGNAFTPLLGITNGQLKLLADCRDIANIIEKRDIAKGRGDACRLRRLVGDRGGSGAAVDEKEIALTKQGHQFGHHAWVRGNERALMVIDARDVRDGLEHFGECSRNFSGRHSRAELLGLRSFVGERLHGQVKHDLTAVAASLVRDGGRMRVVGEDREGERIMQREDGGCRG